MLSFYLMAKRKLNDLKTTNKVLNKAFSPK